MNRREKHFHVNQQQTLMSQQHIHTHTHQHKNLHSTHLHTRIHTYLYSYLHPYGQTDTHQTQS